MTIQPTQQAACWTPAWVRQVTAGRWLNEPADQHATLNGLGIDSRTIKQNQAFLAVKGDNFDGHKFVNKAIQNGAAMVIIDHEAPVIPSDTPGLLIVDNTIEALQRLARAYRNVLKESRCIVIAVVGSNGKTTTRNLIHSVLSSLLKGTQSPKSFNNHLGVPLTLLGAHSDDRFLVAEVGTNHPGEIDALGELLKPDAAVITSIGHEHMAFFGDLHGVATEEAQIIPHVTQGGTLFIEADAFEWIRQAPAFDPSRPTVIYRACVDKESQSTDTVHIGQRLRFSASVTADLPLLAPHDAANATAAVEVGRWMGLNDQQIKTALQNVKPMPGRLEVKQFGPVTVIDDTYNANPDSVRAALEVLSACPIPDDGRRVAVLGDMLELGAISKEAHYQIGKTTRAMLDIGTLDLLILVGPLTKDAVIHPSPDPHAPDVIYHESLNEKTIHAIAQTIQPRDTVLCKASRGLQLERLMPLLRDRYVERKT